MFAPIVESQHHGIPILSSSVSGPVTGTLFFGVGTRDEPPALVGITHLVEHLFLSAVVPNTVRHNAEVGADTVSFYVSGSPDQVRQFLNRIVAAELDTYYDRIHVGMLGYRFGADGIGLHQIGAAGTVGLTKAEIVDWAATWLTAANAMLTFTGPVPAGLDVWLPAGAHVERQDRCEQLIVSPALIESENVGVALSLVTAFTTAPLLAETLAYELLDRLRHAHGLVYSVDRFLWRLDETRARTP